MYTRSLGEKPVQTGKASHEAKDDSCGEAHRI